jgi:polar amino acid transport system ATP-binding protein
MIRIRDLRKHYAGRTVLDGVDAEVQSGRVVALLGPSGSGKSTLLRCLNGLERFEHGSIEIAGLSLSKTAATSDELTRLRSRVGMVFQEFHLFPHLDVLDNVTLAPRVVRKTARGEAERVARELLGLLGLGERVHARTFELSGGQKQRVALARALVQGVEVLLLDEPTSALDPTLKGEVRELLQRVRRGELGDSTKKPLTMLLATHELDLARELADEVWTMNQGRIERRDGAAATSADSA